MEPNFTPANQFFESISLKDIASYTKYWRTLKPKTNKEVFQRYLFAFCSVHTSFQGNISGYRAIRNTNEWINDQSRLKELLIASRCGLHNTRTKSIWNFAQQFWNDPQAYQLKGRSHLSKRNEIVEKISGLGIAKVSFALEMCDPLNARVLCGDVHQLRLYGIEDCKYSSAIERRAYNRMEMHWLKKSSQKKIAPYLARCIFWDKLQGYDDSTYWSNILDNKIAAQPLLPVKEMIHEPV